MKKLIYILGLFLILGTVLATQTTHFDGFSSPENLTFTTGAQNYTRYLSIDRFTNFTSAYMNFTGYPTTISFPIMAWNDSYSAHRGGFGNPTYNYQVAPNGYLGADGNLSTYWIESPNFPMEMIQNFSINTSEYHNITWSVKINNAGSIGSGTFVHYCLNTSGGREILGYHVGEDSGLSVYNYNVPSSCILPGNTFSFNSTATLSLPGNPSYYDSWLNWEYYGEKAPSNASMDIGTHDSTKEWEGTDEYHSTIINSSTCANFVDGDYNTSCNPFNSYINYTLPPTLDLIRNLIIQVKAQVGDVYPTNYHLDISAYNWSSGNYVYIVQNYIIWYSFTTGNPPVTFNVSTSNLNGIVTNGEPLQLAYHFEGDGGGRLYDQDVFFTKVSQNFTEVNQTSQDLSSKLNKVLNFGKCDCVNCSLSGNICRIPFTFYSDKGGILEYSNLSYSSNIVIPPNFTINSPIADEPDTNVTVSFSVQNQSTLDFVYYNITRGESIEKTNTYFNCSVSNCTNIVQSLSLGADGTNYILNIYANYTNGYYNSTSFNFYVEPTNITIIGGGGGGTTIVGTGNWTMETTPNQKSYNLNIPKGTSRKLSVRFKNTGESNRTITLSCQDINGTMCQYVTFENATFSLPLIKDLITERTFFVTLPQEIPPQTATFNIVGTDDEDKINSISVTVSTGNQSFFFEVLTKLSLSTSGGFPYVLIFITSLIVSILLLSGALPKEFPAKAFSSIAIGLVLSSLVIYFV